MKIVLLIAAFLALIGVSGTSALAAQAENPAETPGKKQLYHVVSLSFKPTATPDQIKQVEEAFAALKTKIPGITSLHWGTNVSPEKRNHGFTHCFVLTFATDKDRDVYLVHPEHKAFGTLLGPILGDVMVIDFSDKE
ncbi:MAG: Conserved hypothetical periplasmic protein [Phycisphaerales bacterium]|nr:Conserved hypothetical periplasmic protein [Phycisphaerales bacterium]